MRFEQPLFLIAWLIVPAVILAHGLRARQRRARIRAAGDEHLVSALVDETGTTRRTWSLVFLALAAFFVVLALARPQWGMRTELRKGRGMDLVIALDLSRSMLARDVVPSRLELAKVELMELVGMLAGDRIGLVGFTSVAVPLCPLTVDQAALGLQLKEASADDLPRGGTAIGDAIEESLRMLSTSALAGGARSILLVTDGEEHEGKPEEVARRAHAQGIEVHVVGIGSRTGEPIPLYEKDGSLKGYIKDARGQTVVSRLDESTLEAIAHVGGGLLALPKADGGLDLSPIRSHLLTLKKAEHEARKIRFYEERYQWALWPAFASLFLSTILRPTRRSTSRDRARRRKGKGGETASQGLVVLVMMTLFASGAEASPLMREDVDVKKGSDALAEGRADDAKSAFEAAERRLGFDPRLSFNLGLAETARGELGEATRRFQQALEAGTDASLRGRAALALGNTLRALKKYDDALSAYRRALTEDPSQRGARRNLEITQRLKLIQASQPEGEPKTDGDQKDSPDGPKTDGGVKDAGGSDGTASDADPRDAASHDGGDEPPEDTDGGSSQEDEASNPDRPDGGTKTDEETSEDRADAGAEQDPKRGVDGGADGGGGDGGLSTSAASTFDGGSGEPDAGSASPAEALSAQQAEELLDALEEQEKALKRRRILERVKGKDVTKDW